MKKILLSLAVIALVGVVAVGATRAYFSDTLKSTGNTFTAGTIDISVGGQGFVPVELKDMKPSQVAYSNFTVVNTGSNPVNVTKEIIKVEVSENGVNEPECLAYGGTWTPPVDTFVAESNGCVGDTPVNDIDTVVQYDLSVKVYDRDDKLVWNQTLNDMDMTVAQKNGVPSFLGMIPSGYHMDVVESYHMNKDAGNQYQSDGMLFDILLSGTQLTGVATLSNKNPDRPVKDGWFVLGTKTGTLTYTVKDSLFNYSFTGTAPLASTGYSLVMYEEPFSTPLASGWPRQVIILGAGTTDAAGYITLSGNLDTGSMINAKIWLVKTADLVGSTLNGWNPADYLFDTGMLDYYKS